MGISLWQIAIVVVLVFLLFGAGRLPRMMVDIAKGCLLDTSPSPRDRG